MPVRVWGWLEAFSFLQTVPSHDLGLQAGLLQTRRVPVSVWVAQVWLEAACFGFGRVRTRGASSGLGVARSLQFSSDGAFHGTFTSLQNMKSPTKKGLEGLSLEALAGSGNFWGALGWFVLENQGGAGRAWMP